MIDTISDRVIGDIGDEIVNTGGVAVRPFWWSTECLQTMGLAPPDEVGGTNGGGSLPGQVSTTLGGTLPTIGDASGTAGGSEGNGGTSGQDEILDELFGDRMEKEGGLSGAWITLIAVLGALAAAGVGLSAFLLSRGRRDGPPPGDALAGAVEASGTSGVGAPGAFEGAEPASAFCTQCGRALTPGARFCGSCGAPI